MNPSHLLNGPMGWRGRISCPRYRRPAIHDGLGSAELLEKRYLHSSLEGFGQVR